MLKIASESFIYDLLLFLSLFLKFPVGCLCVLKTVTIVTSAYLHLSMIFVASHFLSAEVSPE